MRGAQSSDHGNPKSREQSAFQFFGYGSQIRISIVQSYHRKIERTLEVPGIRFSDDTSGLAGQALALPEFEGSVNPF